LKVALNVEVLTQVLYSINETGLIKPFLFTVPKSVSILKKGLDFYFIQIKI